MPRFAANLNFLWPELDVYDRFAAAAQAGFRRVETLFVHALDPARVERALADHGLSLVLFDPAPGDWAKGERGLLCVPGREAEFLETVRAAAAAAKRFGTPRVNVLCGVVPEGVSRGEARETALANLRSAARLAAAARVGLLIENINTVDMPGYYAPTPEIAVELIDAVGLSGVRLQLDQYHVAMMGGDAREALRRHFALVDHVQIADVPGRNQPGTGSQPIAGFLDDLDRLGYAGSVGLEYKPRGTMDEALAWLPRDRRG
ncbi:MAG: hydroxypyruvate isomerase family protein [Myxococcales bacterium]